MNLILTSDSEEERSDRESDNQSVTVSDLSLATQAFQFDDYQIPKLDSDSSVSTAAQSSSE